MPRFPAAHPRRVSLSLKLTLFLVLQTAGTLAAVALYYAWLGQDIRTYHGIFSRLMDDARLLHRRLDDPAPLGAAGRDSFRAFTANIDVATGALTHGGDFEGFRCQPIPDELAGLFDEILARWKRTRRALVSTVSSTAEQEKGARKKLHSVFPPWQASLMLMQKSLVHREGTIRTQLANAFVLIGSVNLAFLALVLWLVRRYITGPVQVVQAAAIRVGRGDYSVNAPVSGTDEISSLAAEFNRMSARLQETVSALRSSEQKLTEKADALEKSNRELEQYAYAAAHDLQEPVRTLSLYVQLLNRRYPLPPDAVQLTSQIQTSAERMSRLVGDLLVHSRSVHETPRSIPTDPNTALSEALAHLDDEIRKAGAVVRSPEPLPGVVASGPDLELVFRNVIANALKYRGDTAPCVSISGAVGGGLCTIRVQDNGIGIDPQYHQRVFGLFKRLHGPEVPGTGVGLAVAKNLIEKHGGRIWVESQPGQGAAFNFQLTLAPAAAPLDASSCQG